MNKDFNLLTENEFSGNLWPWSFITGYLPLKYLYDFLNPAMTISASGFNFLISLIIAASLIVWPKPIPVMINNNFG